MVKIPTWLTVVAGALQDADGRFLLQRRPPGKAHAGLWEFPGGKVEYGESPRDALVRELSEELAIRVRPAALTPLAFAEEDPAEDRTGIVILLYKVSIWQGKPMAEEGAELGWFDCADARRLPLPPLDEILLQSLFRGVE